MEKESTPPQSDDRSKEQGDELTEQSIKDGRKAIDIENNVEKKSDAESAKDAETWRNEG